MSQKLFVKVKAADGSVSLKPVLVLRSWQESDGRQIYLHANGVYGYKDGAPIRSRDELAIIGAANQHKLAVAWWDRVGRKMSEAHYRQAEDADQARQLEGLPVMDGASSDLDAMMYVRRPKPDGKKKKGDWSEPTTWPEYGFRTRPEWWGFAEAISIGGYEYQIVAVETLDDPDTQKRPAEEGKTDAMAGTY